jgi:hypothetical protein
MKIQRTVTVAAAPATISRIYRDVSSRHTWDPDTKSASLDGPFIAGACGRLTPAKGSTVPMRLTEVVPDRCFTVESSVPLFQMRFDNMLTPSGAATEVVHRATFSGPLSCLLGRLLCRRLAAGLPTTLARLKALAERMEQDPCAGMPGAGGLSTPPSP